MPEYKRFVAYFYEYIDGKKQKNAGFAKVELRNGMWRVLFRLTVPVLPEAPARVYGFVRDRGQLREFLLGTMNNGCRGPEEWAWRAQTPVGMEKYYFDQLAGMRIQSGEGRMFLTVWDDEEVNPEQFAMEPEQLLKRADGMEPEQSLWSAEDTEPEQSTRSAEEVEPEQPSGSSEEDTKSEQTKAEETSEKMREDSLRLVREFGQQREQPEVPEEEETRRIPEEMPVMPEEEQPEQKPEEPIEVQPGQSPEEMPAMPEEVQTEQMPEMPEQAQPQEMQQKTSQQAAIDKSTETFRSPVQAQAVLDIESVINGKEKESAVAHSGRSCAETLLRGRQPYQPFRDDEFTDCVQIKLCDVLPLQQEKWQVGRSNFLQHGYYLYRHLLFGRAKNGAYILGVPGVRSQQEEYMAHLFGYDQFKLSRISNCGRKFGYWYRLLKEPERVS